MGFLGSFPEPIIGLLSLPMASLEKSGLCFYKHTVWKSSTWLTLYVDGDNKSGDSIRQTTVLVNDANFESILEIYFNEDIILLQNDFRVFALSCLHAIL